MTDQTLLPCPFCGGEAEIHDIGNDLKKPRKTEIVCTQCHVKKVVAAIHNPLSWTRATAIEEWNRRTPPAAVPEPWGWLCNGKGDGWEERDKVVRDPELIARYRERPDLWRIEPLYLGSPPAAVPDGWVMVPKEPTPEMLDAATPPESYWIGHPWAKPGSIERWRQGHREDAERKYRSMISAAPAAPNGWQPIETAPKDGTWILGWSTKLTIDYQPRRVCWGTDVFGCSGWRTEYEFLGENITHWMPLPAAPTETSDE